MVGFTRVAHACAILMTAVVLSGCVSFRPLEPVISPPAKFRTDTLVPIEFVNPATIGLRCAGRGAKFLMLPGVNSNACSSADLVTMPNPCLTLTGGAFATALCREIAQAGRREPTMDAASVNEVTATLTLASMRAGSPTAPSRARFTGQMTVPVEFVETDKVALRCAERGAKMYDAEDGIEACADQDLITMPNPCAEDEAGWYAKTMCHEMAHANGWPSDHAGGKLFYASANGQLKPARSSAEVAQFADRIELATGSTNASFQVLEAPAAPAWDEIGVAEPTEISGWRTIMPTRFRPVRPPVRGTLHTIPFGVALLEASFVVASQTWAEVAAPCPALSITRFSRWRRV